MFKRSKVIFALAGLVALVFGGGCGGASGTYSASPASVLLPGILEVTPESPLSPSSLQTNATPTLLAGRQ